MNNQLSYEPRPKSYLAKKEPFSENQKPLIKDYQDNRTQLPREVNVLSDNNTVLNQVHNIEHLKLPRSSYNDAAQAIAASKTSLQATIDSRRLNSDRHETPDRFGITNNAFVRNHQENYSRSTKPINNTFEFEQAVFGNQNSAKNENSNNTFDRDSQTGDSVTGNPRRKLILVMKIDIGEGRGDDLTFYEGDEPFAVAQAFCFKNRLADKVIEPLTKNILTQLNNYSKYKQEKLRQRSLSRNASRNELQQAQPGSQESFNTLNTREENGGTNLCQEEQTSLGESCPVLESDRTVETNRKFEFKEDSQFNTGASQGKLTVKKAAPAQKELRNQKPNIEFKSAESVHANPQKVLEVAFRKTQQRETENIPSLFTERTNVRKAQQNSASRKSSKSPSFVSTSSQQVKRGRSLSTKSIQEDIDKMNLTSSTRFPSQKKFENDEDDDLEKNDVKKLFVNAKKETFNRLQRNRSQRTVLYEEKAKPQEVEENTFRPYESYSNVPQRSKETASKNPTETRVNKKDLNLDLSERKLSAPKKLLMVNGSTSVRNANHENDKGRPILKESSSTAKLYSKQFEKKVQEKQSFEKKATTKQPLKSAKPDSNPKGGLVYSTDFKNTDKSKTLRPNKALKTQDSTSKARSNGIHSQPINERGIRTQTEKSQVLQESVSTKEGISTTTKKGSLRDCILKRTRSEKKINNETREEKVARIVFETLDSSQNGIITADSVDISTIDPKILEVISEVLFAMEDEELSLDLEKFYQKLIEENLIARLVEVVPVPEINNDFATNDSQSTQKLKEQPNRVQKSIKWQVASVDEEDA